MLAVNDMLGFEVVAQGHVLAEATVPVVPLLSHVYAAICILMR